MADDKEETTLIWIDSAEDHVYIRRSCTVCSANVHYPFKEKNVKMLKSRSCICPSCRDKMKKSDTGKRNDQT
jgi:hypothetical protein